MPTQRRSAKSAPAGATGGSDSSPTADIRVLKKYPNRRLYDTRSSSYITLADVKQMVLEGELFEVRDAKTGDEITRSILLQIILEEETGGMPMFTTTMLEKNMAAFAELQTQFISQGKGLYDPKHLSPEVWSQFMTGQAPALKGIMDSYLEQSRGVFEKMQQAGSIFPGIAGIAGMTGITGFPGSKK